MALVGIHLALLLLSHSFAGEQSVLSQPVGVFVGLEICAGICYLLALLGLRARGHGASVVWILAVGLVLRGTLFFSTPVLEDDYYRYLWDGAITSAGENPYARSPSEVMVAAEVGRDLPGAWISQAKDAGQVLQRVNHPHLRTIYPPTAQAAFALAHWVSPFSLAAWRVVLLAFDLATLALLALVLRTLGLPRALMAIYWWNPLLVREIYNSGHMDMLVLPFVVGAVWLALRRHHVAGAVVLAVAAGTKLWPVLLLPVLLRPLWREPRRLAMALSLHGATLGLLLLPLLLTGRGADAGLTAYGSSWEMNDSLFLVILWISQGALGLLQSTIAVDAQFMARVLVLAVLGAWIIYQVRTPVEAGTDLVERCLLVVGAALLLSPTQFPWYYIWLLPFLAIRPRPSLLLWTVLLPLYYLRFRYAAVGRAAFFDNGIVFLEHVPIWILLGWEWWSRRRQPDFSSAISHENDSG